MAANFKKLKKKALEAFIVSDEKKEGALKFGMHTEPYEYYLLLYEINKSLEEKKKTNWKEIEKKLEDYKKKFGERSSYSNLAMRFGLVKVELEDKDSKRNDALDEFNKKFLFVKKDYIDPKRRISKILVIIILDQPLQEDNDSSPNKSKSDTTTIREEYTPYTDIPHSFVQALPEKKFNREWEEYMKKNPSMIKPEYLSSFTAAKNFEDFPAYIYTYLFEVNPDVIVKTGKKRGHWALQSMLPYMSATQMTSLWSSFKDLRSDQSFAAEQLLIKSINDRLLHKKFHKQIDKINNSKNPEKIAKNYLKIYRGFRKEFEGWFKSFSEQIVHEIEVVLIGQHVLYLAKSLQRDQNIIYELLERLQYYYTWDALVRYFGITNYDPEFSVADIAWDYLFHNLKDKTWSHSTITKYWKNQNPDQIYVNIKSLQGDADDPTVNKILKKSPNLANLNSDEVILQPTMDNKPFFSPGEKVSIRMKLKNIQQLTIKIFQIDSIKFYTLHNKEIETDINLDGLVANSEQIKDFTLNSQNKLLFESFNVDLPNDGRGIYIVDFIGNVKSCRVVIRRGMLKYLSRDSDDGTVFYVLDENNEICKSDRTGVMVGKDYYKSDPVTGKISIGYRDCTQTKAILVQRIVSLQIIRHEEYGQFVNDIKFYKDLYKLSADFILPWESLIVGNNVKLALKVVLSKNQKPLKVTSNHNLNLTLTLHDEEGVKYTQTFENVVPSDHGTYDIEFKVFAGMTKVRLHASCSIFSKSLDRVEKLEDEAEKVCSANNQSSFVGLYLKENAEGYYLQVLGKNGEPKKFVKVYIDAFHQFTNTNALPRVLQAVVQSNEEGVIKLGKLPSVSRIRCQTELRRGAPGSTVNFDLNRSHKSVANNILCYEQELIKIPCELNMEKYLTDRTASLVEVSGKGAIIEDVSKQIQFTPLADNSNDGSIELKLPRGYYQLYIKKWNICYNIRIIATKGFKIIDDDILIQGNKIIQNYRYLNGLQVTKFTYNQEASTIKLNIAHSGPGVKVYAYAKHFLDNENESHNTKIFNTLSFPDQITYTTPKQVNLYLYGRKLHEEYNYVIERKNAKKYIGNSLEKPTLILKRMFIQDTKTSEQKAQEGTEFKKKDISGATQLKNQQVADRIDNSIKEYPYYEFLSLPTKVYDNLKIRDGLIEIQDADLKKFSSIYFVIFDEGVVINKEYSLKENLVRLPTRDLSLKKAFSDDSGFQKRKHFDVIKKGGSFEIPDVYNCEYQVFDTLDRVFIHLRENGPNHPDFKKWDFLLKWDTLTTEEKHKYYNEFYSNEINLFIFFKDKEYFQNVVQPYIENKLSKSLIDKFLLNEPSQDLFAFEKIIASNTIELLLIALLDGKNQTLRARILNKIKPMLKEDFSDEDLRSEKTATFGEETFKNSYIDQNVSHEKEFYYEKEWRNINPGQVWAYLLAEVCKDQNLNRSSLETVRQLPLPRFMPKGANLLETILLMAFLNLPLKQVMTRIESNSELGVIISGNCDFLVFRDEFKKSEFSITNTTLVKMNLTTSLNGPSCILGENEPIWTDANCTCNLVLTNLTAIEQDYTILFQVPQGSICSSQNKTIFYKKATLSAFKTTNVTFPQFYFPFEGRFEHAPIFVFSDNQVVAYTERRTYDVKYQGQITVPNKDAKKDYQRRDKVGAAKKRELLDILKNDPILDPTSGFVFSDIYHLLKDQDFYQKVIGILKRRFIYDENTYSFSVIHHDFETIPIYFDAIKDYFKFEYHYAGQLVKQEPHENGFRYLDYYPLVNQRVHKLGKSKKILNDKFKEQYRTFLKVLASRYKISSEEAMWFIYYLLLQDKIDVAIEFYTKFNQAIVLDNRIQFEYLRCYMDFYLGAPNYKTALEISEKYLLYPVIGWRKLFENVNYKVKKALNLGAEVLQVENIKEKKDIDIHDIVISEQNKMLRNQKFEHDIVVKGEKSLDVTVKEQEIKLNFTCLEKIEISYYPIDYEILISYDPFSPLAFEKCTFIKTSNNDLLDAKGKTSLNVPIPKQYLHQALFIQVKGDDYLQKEEVFFESNLIVYVNKEQKLIQILDSKERALPLCYIKIFYKSKSGPGFAFADGFTDFRGLYRYLTKEEDHNNYGPIKLFASHEEYGMKLMEI